MLKTAPFEAYEIYRGATKGGRSLMFGDKSQRVVGVMKGIIRVCVSDPRYEKTPFFDMKAVSKVSCSLTPNRKSQPAPNHVAHTTAVPGPLVATASCCLARPVV